MSYRFFSVLQGSELKTKRDYRVAAAVLGHEAVTLIKTIVNTYNGGEQNPNTPWRKCWNEEAERHAIQYAAQAAHFARLGVATLTEPERARAVA